MSVITAVAIGVLGLSFSLWGQECVPVDGHPDSGTMTGTVVSALPRNLLVKSKGVVYEMDWKQPQSAGIQAGDLVKVQYSGLLNCYRTNTWVASVVSITKTGHSSSGAIPPGAVTVVGRVVRKTPSGRFELQTGPGNPLTLDISSSDSSFIGLNVGDRVRVTYVPTGCSGPMADVCLGTALRVVKVVPNAKKRS